MSRTLEFFFDFGSPTAFLAFTQVRSIADACGATLIYRPMLLGAVFKATGNQSPVMIAAKGRYMGQDMLRFAKRYGQAFKMNPYFPINTLYLMRAAAGIQLREPERLQAFLEAIYPALWVEGKNLGDADVLSMVLNAHGFDAKALFALIEQDEVKNALKASTDEAVQRGVFGAPTFFVGEQMFFGQDRLDFVKEALEA